MRSKWLLFSGLFLCATVLFFCSKDDSPQVEESPFFDFFNDKSIVIDTIEQSADNWEYGFVFKPKRSGRVTQFGVKVPATGDFTVTLWNLSGGTPVVVGSKTVVISALSDETGVTIPEILLEKGVRYGITVRSNAFYRISRPGNEKFAFPRTVGNIEIESFNEKVNNTSNATFPTTTNDTRVAPCVNVVFIAD